MERTDIPRDLQYTLDSGNWVCPIRVSGRLGRWWLGSPRLKTQSAARAAMGNCASSRGASPGSARREATSTFSNAPPAGRSRSGIFRTILRASGRKNLRGFEGFQYSCRQLFSPSIENPPPLGDGLCAGTSAARPSGEVTYYPQGEHRVQARARQSRARCGELAMLSAETARLSLRAAKRD
jgi:hypothetical protein